MSVTLRVELDPGPIERARAEVAVATFFAQERPLRGSAGRADWRLCGRLSRLLAAGEIEGLRGEALLIPTGGGLRAPLLVVLGLGPRDRFLASDWEATARDAVERGVGLGARSIALPMPDESGPEVGDRTVLERVEALLTGAARALADRDLAVRLQLLAPPAWAEAAARALQNARPRELPPSVALELPATRAGRAAPARPGPGSGPQRSAAS